jgi:hypothetical protein
VKEFEVVWRIQQDVRTPRKAAANALEIIQQAILSGTGLIFEVGCPDGSLVTIDLTQDLAHS